MIKPVLDMHSSLQATLAQLPGLVNSLQRKDQRAPDQFISWLQSTEDLLQQGGYAQCADLAALRSKMLIGEHKELKRSERVRERFKSMAEILFEAQQVLAKLLQPMDERIHEARTLIRQIYLIIKPSGILVYKEESGSFTQFIHQIWHILKNNEQFGGGVSRLLSAFNPSDIYRMLAEEIEVAK